MIRYLWRDAALLGLSTAILLCGRAPSLAAQRVTLSVTGGAASTFPNPTVADYVNGYVDNPAPVTFSLATTFWLTGSSTVTSTVEICSANANLTNGKALVDLTWRPSDLSKPYASIVQGCAGAVNSARTIVTHQQGWFTTWTGGGVILRMALRWASDNAASYGTPILLRVSVVSP